jgi:serine O-acetyltransferase
MHEIHIPGQRSVDGLIAGVFKELFPIAPAATDGLKEKPAACLDAQLSSVLSGLTGAKEEVIQLFLASFDETRDTLLKDAAFILESDPAATELMEVIAIYPGFYAIFCYRIAHRLAKMKVRLLPRMISEHAHRVTGIDIHPLAEIGVPFSIDHGTGIVVGETAVIGHRVKMYQGVTLGALSVDKRKAASKRHPTIEDDVILYAGCTILGGETVVGRNSVIGGNVWLTESIQANSVVYHKSEIVVRSQKGFDEPVNFII